MGSGRGGCSANYWFGRIDRISPHSVPNPKPRVSIFLAICQNIFTVEIMSDGSLSSDIGTSPSLLTFPGVQLVKEKRAGFCASS